MDWRIVVEKVQVLVAWFPDRLTSFAKLLTVIHGIEAFMSVGKVHVNNSTAVPEDGEHQASPMTGSAPQLPGC